LKFGAVCPECHVPTGLLGIRFSALTSDVLLEYACMTLTCSNSGQLWGDAAPEVALEFVQRLVAQHQRGGP